MIIISQSIHLSNHHIACLHALNVYNFMSIISQKTWKKSMSSLVLYACPRKKTMKFTLSIKCEQINREKYLSRGKYLGIEVRNLDADCNNIASRIYWFWVFFHYWAPHSDLFHMLS